MHIQEGKGFAILEGGGVNGALTIHRLNISLVVFLLSAPEWSLAMEMHLHVGVAINIVITVGHNSVAMALIVISPATIWCYIKLH